MNCTKYKDRLIDLALSATMPEDDPEFLAHVRECAACAAELERQRQLVAAMDHGVKLSVSANPSPEFLPRIRTRLAEEPAPARGWFSGWLPVTAGAVAVVALLMFLLLPRERGEPPTEPPMGQRATVAPAADLAVEPPRAEVPAAPRKRPHKILAERKPVAPAVPEVLVPGDQQAGLAWLYRALRQRPEQVAGVLAEQTTYRSESAGPIRVAELRTEPLELPPLAPPSSTSLEMQR